MRTAKATIDLAALSFNLDVARRIAPESKVLAVVKAHAYGHGVQAAVEALAAADAYAVSCLDEAIVLRQFTEKRIVVLQGFYKKAHIETLVSLNLDVVLHQLWQLEWLQQAMVRLPRRVLNVWLKMETGMHRLGIDANQVSRVIDTLQSMPVVDQIILMTHMACADDTLNAFTERQLTVFCDVAEPYHLPGSVANSAAMFAWPESRMQWCRPGIMLYGVSPFIDKTGEELGLKPVMQLSTELIAIKSCRRGDMVGYGNSWVCPRDMRVGIAAIGYGDGYPRHAVSGTPVLVKDQVVSLVGRVSMDMIAVDLTDNCAAVVGDRVILWGQGVPVETVASFASTIAYELLCGVYGRVEYQYCRAVI